MKAGPAVTALLLMASMLPATTGEDRSSAAKRMTVREPAFRKIDVALSKSIPPQFELVLERDMPTPGWTLAVDEVVIDAGRITAHVTEVAPPRGGVTAQVITPATLRLSLGALDTGAYVVELRLRRGETAPYRPVQAWVLDAF